MEMKPLLMSELVESVGCPVWFESRNGRPYTGWVLVYEVHNDGILPGQRIGLTRPSSTVMWPLLKQYNKRWRCWSDKPTKNAKWEDE